MRFLSFQPRQVRFLMIPIQKVPLKIDFYLSLIYFRVNDMTKRWIHIYETWDHIALGGGKELRVKIHFTTEN